SADMIRDFLGSAISIQYAIGSIWQLFYQMFIAVLQSHGTPLSCWSNGFGREIAPAMQIRVLRVFRQSGPQRLLLGIYFSSDIFHCRPHLLICTERGLRIS